VAYPKDVFIASSGGTGVTISYTAIEDDFMFLCHQKKYGTVSGTPSGWTSLSYNGIGANGFNNSIWYRRATASEPTSVTVTSTGSSQDGQLIVCRGVDTTTAFDVTASSRTNGAADQVTSTAITPVTANSLILNICINNGAQIVPAPGPIKIQRNDILSYYTYGAGASVAVPAHPYYCTTDDNINPTLVTIALRDDGGGEDVGFIDIASPPCTVLHMLGKGGETGHLTGTAGIDLTGIITTLQGISTSFKTGNGGSGFEEGIQPSGYTTNFTSQACALNASSTNVTYDLENEIISLSGNGDSSLYDSYDALAKHWIMGDGTNFRAWRIDALNSTPSGKDSPLVHVIQVDGGFETEEFGTVTATTLQTIDNYAYGCRGDSSYASQSWGFLYKLSTMMIIGGSTAFPTSMNIGVDCAKTTSLRTVSSQNQQSQTQFFCAQKIQVGNGTTATTWDSKQHSLEWPSASSTTERRVQILVGAGLLGFAIDASASCSIDISTTTFNMGNLHEWALISGTSTAATYVEAGALVISAEVTLRDIGRAFAGMTFTGCNEINKNDADLSGGNTIDGCVETNAITITTESLFDELANCTFTNNNRAILITGDQSGSWSDPNFTMSGNTFDIEYTGTTNFSIQSANGITVNDASSGVLTIVTPVTSFTINSSEAGALIQIFATGTQTVLASTTGSTLNHVFTGTVVVDYVVQKARFTPQRFVGETLSDSSTTVNLPPSREYDSGHGLVYSTNASWSRSLNELTVPTWGVTGQGVFSLMMDSFIAESSLFNTAFNLEMDGTGSLFLTNDAEGASDASITNLIECGCAYLDTSSVTTASFVGVKSVGTATGFTGEFQQIDGTTTTDARTTGIFNELIKMYGDGTHGSFDYRGHLVLKYQPNTYRESRSDVLSDYGLSTLAPTLYIVAMSPVAIDITAGDPAISITIVDHTASPLVVGGKSFDFEIQDGGANDGTAMLREVNYNLSQDATYQGRDPFNWPEMILKSGATFETIRGLVEGISGDHGIYVSRSAADHPNFTRFQSNDGTYYVKPITANASISSIVSGSRLRIYNETTATETYNDLPGTSFSDSYTEGTTYTSGDVITVYITQTSGVTAQIPFTTTAIASSTGWTVLAAQVSDTVYDGYGLNGSTITKFTADYVNDEVDLTIASNYSGAEMYSWWAYNLTTVQGISDFFGGVTAQDGANIIINNSVVSIFLDNTTATNVYQTDNIRWYRTDQAYPVKNPTSGGGGIDVVWRDRVFVATVGSGPLTAAQDTELFKNSTILVNTVDIESKVDIVDLVVDDIKTAVITNAAGVDISADIAAVQADTDTNIPAQIAALANFDPAVDVVEGTETFSESMRLIRANAAGAITDDGVNSAILKSEDGLKDRINATYASDGSRTINSVDKT
jgi:hypothetical protein